MTSSSFARMATVTASTKRAPAVTGGKRGTPTTYISSLNCVPLAGIDPELKQRMGITALGELFQTVVSAGLNIREGDILVVGSTEYPIRAVGNYTWPPGTDEEFHVLILDDPTSGKWPLPSA